MYFGWDCCGLESFNGMVPKLPIITILRVGAQGTSIYRWLLTHLLSMNQRRLWLRNEMSYETTYGNTEDINMQTIGDQGGNKQGNNYKDRKLGPYKKSFGKT